MPETVVTFTADEVRLALALVSEIDPDKYKSPGTKSLIYKCADAHAPGSTYRRFRIEGVYTQ